MSKHWMKSLQVFPLILLLVMALSIPAEAQDVRTAESASEMVTADTNSGGNRLPADSEATSSQQDAEVTVDTKKENQEFPVALAVGAVVVVAAGCAAFWLWNRSKTAKADTSNLDVPVTSPFKTEPVRKSQPSVKPQSAPKKEYELCIEGGDMDGQIYPLTKEPMLLGRAESCRIRYAEKTPGISGQHCRIWLENGEPMLMDLNSSNGTLINKTPVRAKIPTALHDGDIIWLGGKGNTVVIRSKK